MAKLKVTANVSKSSKSFKDSKHFKHLEHLYVAFCLGIVALGCILIGFWQFYPDNILKITEPVVTDKLIYRPGERITYSLSYCKARKIPAEVIRSLINGTRLNFTTISTDLPVGCHTINISDLVIPDYADSDTYHLEATIRFKLNPIKNFLVSWESNEFKIKK